MSIAVVLYQSLLEAQSLHLPPGLPTSGKQFEDYMVKQLHIQLQQAGGSAVYPPRHTLRQTTFSGVFHQFDIIVEQLGIVYAIECKFRGIAHIDQLFATQGKLIDYRNKLQGIFVTTALTINKEFLCYALAHRIQLITTNLPPIEYMLARVCNGSDLSYRLEMLRKRLREGANPTHTLIEWRNAYRRFQDEGYQ